MMPLLEKPRRAIAAWSLLIPLVLVAGAHAEVISGRVVGVADGDTVTVLDGSLQQHKIRLSGIDAPEKRQPFGQRSKESLSGLVFARQVTVETDKKDRYGREVGRVRIDGIDVNLEQIKRGFAWHYTAYAKEQPWSDRRTYAAAEEEARVNLRGLWRDAQPVPPWDFRKHRAGRSVARVYDSTQSNSGCEFCLKSRY